MGLSWVKRSGTAADLEAVATRPATGWRWGSPKGAAAGIGNTGSRFPRKPCLFIPSAARLAKGCVNECDPRGNVGVGLEPDRCVSLRAEMRLPGEALLDFRIEPRNKGQCILHQTALFRPRGLLGLIYWYAVLPFHHLVFRSEERRVG